MEIINKMVVSNYDNQNLDKEELALDELFTSSEASFMSKEELGKEKKRFSWYTIKSEQKKSINIRLLSSDVAKIKAKAEAIWIPYQTLLILKMHEFANS